MVTFVKSTYPGSSAKYAVSGVRVSCGPTKGGNNEIRLQLAGTELELDINVDYAVAVSIQRAIDEVIPSERTFNNGLFGITGVSAKALIDELYNRFNEE